MARFIVHSSLSVNGRKDVLHDPAALPDITAELSAFDAKVVAQYALLGTDDYLTIVDIPVPADAFKLSVAERNAQSVVREIYPAMDLSLFIRLLGQTTETVGPHRWQITAPARAARSVLQWRYQGSLVRRYCKPLDIRGAENLADLRGPAIFIGNHTSHMDSSVLLYSVPRQYRTRVFFGGAADRFFLKGRKEIKKQALVELVAGQLPGAPQRRLGHPRLPEVADRQGVLDCHLPGRKPVRQREAGQVSPWRGDPRPGQGRTGRADVFRRAGRHPPEGQPGAPSVPGDHDDRPSDTIRIRHLGAGRHRRPQARRGGVARRVAWGVPLVPHGAGGGRLNIPPAPAGRRS